MTTLTPMRPQAYQAFFDLTIADYAEENVASGRWLEADALTLARADTERLLPQGPATPDHYLYEIQVEASQPTVGYIWFAAVARGSAQVAFVYQLFVFPEFRRRGHARAALLAVEKLARELGLANIGLHVFGHNTAAQALYQSIGYQVASLNLLKPLHL